MLTMLSVTSAVKKWQCFNLYGRHMTNVLKKIKSNDATQSWRLQEKLKFLLFFGNEKNLCSQRAFVAELIRLLLKANYKNFSQLNSKPYSRAHSRKWKQKYLNQRILTRQDVSSDPRVVVHVDSMIAPSKRREARIKQNHRPSCWIERYNIKRKPKTAADCARWRETSHLANSERSFFYEVL